MKILVNSITTIRFIYTLFLPFLASTISPPAFMINIMILFSTDAIDGTLARKYKVQTFYGSMMDTIADKALSIMLLFILINKLNLIVTMLILEFTIALINIIAFIQGKKPNVSLFGKIKMWLLSLTILTGYIYYFGMISNKLVIFGTIVTAISQIIVIIDYIIKLSKIKSNTKNTQKQKEKINLKEILFSTDYYINSYKNND